MTSGHQVRPCKTDMHDPARQIHVESPIGLDPGNYFHRLVANLNVTEMSKEFHSLFGTSQNYWIVISYISNLIKLRYNIKE